MACGLVGATTPALARIYKTDSFRWAELPRVSHLEFVVHVEVIRAFRF